MDRCAGILLLLIGLIAIPAGAHPPLRQAAVMLKTSARKPLAAEFLAYLQRPDVRAILERFGLGAASEPAR